MDQIYIAADESRPNIHNEHDSLQEKGTNYTTLLYQVGSYLFWRAEKMVKLSKKKWSFLFKPHCIIF